MKTIKSVLVLATVIALYSCEKNAHELFNKSELNTNAANLNLPVLPNLPVLNGVTYCGQKTVPLCAGQNINIGTVTVTSATNGKVYITYKTTGNWKIREIHLYAGPLSGLPVNNAGNPVPGQFPYEKKWNPPFLVQEYTFVLTGLPQSFIVAAHASVMNTTNGIAGQQETAWGDGCSGTQINPDGQWGTYFTYTQENCETMPEICSNAINYFFDSTINGLNIPWKDMNGALPGVVTVGGFNYTEEEGRAIYEATHTYGATPDARKAFVSVATLKLSGTNYAQEPALTAAVTTCEVWLGVCYQLTPSYLPLCTLIVTDASNQIDGWISTHVCPDRR